MERRENPPRRLDPAERPLLLQAFVEGRDRETEYLRRATGTESFQFDVGRLVTESTWQGGTAETDDPVQAEPNATTDAYHQWLAASGGRPPPHPFSRPAARYSTYG